MWTEKLLETKSGKSQRTRSSNCWKTKALLSTMNNSRRLFHKLLTIQIHPIQMKTQNQSMKKKIFLIKFRAEKALMIYDMIWYCNSAIFCWICKCVLNLRSQYSYRCLSQFDDLNLNIANFDSEIRRICRKSLSIENDIKSTGNSSIRWLKISKFKVKFQRLNNTIKF